MSDRAGAVMDWSTTVVCASGPSFSVDQAALIIEARKRDRCRVVVVNDNYKRVPNADLLYAADGAWWKYHLNRGLRQCFGGELWTQDHAAAERHGLRYVPFVRGLAPLPHGDSRISGGSNSGLHGMMMARQRGARRVILVGFDCSGDSHWFGLHPAIISNGNAGAFVKSFNAIAGPLRDEGTEVINCSAKTALECFPRADLAETLEQLP